MADTTAHIYYINHYAIENDFYLNGNIFNFAKLLEMVLETSGDHDRYFRQELNTSFLASDESWVITQNHFHVFAYPSVGSKIAIETRVNHANRFFVDRWFGIKAGEKLLMEFQIQYTIINLLTRKMARIPVKRLKENDLIDNSFYQTREKIMQPANLISSSKLPQSIEASDIDENDHVNNVVYIRWGAQALPFEILSNFSIKKVAIKYGSEILPNHRVTVETFLPPTLISATAAAKEVKVTDVNQFESFQIIRNETNEQDACLLHLYWDRNNLN